VISQLAPTGLKSGMNILFYKRLAPPELKKSVSSFFSNRVFESLNPSAKIITNQCHLRPKLFPILRGEIKVETRRGDVCFLICESVALILIKAIDKEIDDPVYKLYNLTYDEIKIVEGKE
jgi:hypothetical protein